MFHSFDQALEWIHGRLRLGIKPGLLRMEWMLEKLGNPERSLKTIHVGGTNGKGSTVTFLRSILETAGYRTGTFTSPYFEHFNERISINGKQISDEDIVKLTNVIKPLADELEQTELGGPTEFEVVTAMSMYYFAKLAPVDVVIYEVGLGGRFDSTNVIVPLISVITSIGLDHTNILGDSYDKIAFEKAGIIKKGVSVVTAVKQPEALEVIKYYADEQKAPFYLLGEHFFANERKSLKNGEEFSFASMFHNYGQLEISMIGSHQVENASLAVMTAQVLSAYYSFMINEGDIKEGLQTAFWPGRLEILSEIPLVLIDGAHNEEGIKALAGEINSRYAEKKVRVLFAALKDKKLDGMISILEKAADSLAFTSFDFPRAASAEEMAAIAGLPEKVEVVEDYKVYLEQQLASLDEDEMLLITGSLYFLSEVKPYVLSLL